MEGRWIRPVRTMSLALIAVTVISLAAGPAQATHPRPKGATPITTSLVPAFKQCPAPNRTHGAPLAFPSCAPPVPTTQFTTLGTPDVNGASANWIGRVRFDAVAGSPGPPEDADIFTAVNITDVRCTAATSGAICNSANSSGGQDYSGEIQVVVRSRVTDHNNGPSLTEAATLTDIPFPYSAPCVDTADTSVGGTCALSTTFNTVVPGAIKETKRTSWEMDQVEVFDGGPDGRSSTSDNFLLAVPGVFAP